MAKIQLQAVAAAGVREAVNIRVALSLPFRYRRIQDKHELPGPRGEWFRLQRDAGTCIAGPRIGLGPRERGE